MLINTSPLTSLVTYTREYTYELCSRVDSYTINYENSKVTTILHDFLFMNGIIPLHAKDQSLLREQLEDQLTNPTIIYYELLEVFKLGIIKYYNSLKGTNLQPSCVTILHIRKLHSTSEIKIKPPTIKPPTIIN
jgi:hypothetical protein